MNVSHEDYSSYHNETVSPSNVLRVGNNETIPSSHVSSLGKNGTVSLSKYSVEGNETVSSSNYHGLEGNETTMPSSPPSMNEVIVDGPFDTITQSVFLWFGLLAFYYVCGPRRSHVQLDENLVQERLRRIRAEEVAKEARLTPEKRKAKINKQIMSGIITKFDTAKFRLAGMKKASLELPVNECHSEDNSSQKKSNLKVKCNTISQPQYTDYNLEMKPAYGGTDGSQTQQENNTTLECSICLEELEPGEKLSWSRSLKCEHVFHEECLMSWLMAHDECPYCRTEMIGENINSEKDVEAIIYSDVPPDGNEGSPVDANVYHRLKSFIQRSASYFQPQRITRIEDEENGSGTLSEFVVDV